MVVSVKVDKTSTRRAMKNLERLEKKTMAKIGREVVRREARPLAKDMKKKFSEMPDTDPAIIEFAKRSIMVRTRQYSQRAVFLAVPGLRTKQKISGRVKALGRVWHGGRGKNTLLASIIGAWEFGAQFRDTYIPPGATFRRLLDEKNTEMIRRMTKTTAKLVERETKLFGVRP